MSVADDSVSTPDDKNEIVPLCPLKRQLSTEYNADDEQSQEEVETRSPLAPKKLDFEQQVLFGNEQDEEASEKKDEEDDHPVPTQKYEPPEQSEEGELEQPVARTLTCAEISG